MVCCARVGEIAMDPVRGGATFVSGRGELLPVGQRVGHNIWIRIWGVTTYVSGQVSLLPMYPVR